MINIQHSDPVCVQANGVELVYDTFGSLDASPLLLIEGLGHELPPAVWPQVLKAIAGHAR